jgi:hypothetical protein
LEYVRSTKGQRAATPTNPWVSRIFWRPCHGSTGGHRLDAGLDRSGPAHDSCPRVLLRGPGACEERPQHAHDVLRCPGGRGDGAGSGGYSVAFSPGTALVGDLSRALLQNVGLQAQGTIPHVLFMAYQGIFAIITAAPASGAVVERMQFRAYLVLLALWALVVYAPIAHWVWGGGARAVGCLGLRWGERWCTSTREWRRRWPPCCWENGRTGGAELFRFSGNSEKGSQDVSCPLDTNPSWGDREDRL